MACERVCACYAHKVVHLCSNAPTCLPPAHARAEVRLPEQWDGRTGGHLLLCGGPRPGAPRCACAAAGSVGCRTLRTLMCAAQGVGCLR